MAQTEPTQQVVPVHGAWLSVTIRPVSPVGWFGSGTPSCIWEDIRAVHVCGLAAPTAPGLGQWSSVVAVSGTQRVVFRIGYWKPSSK